MTGPCLCGDDFCPSCGGMCPHCNYDGDEIVPCAKCGMTDEEMEEYLKESMPDPKEEAAYQKISERVARLMEDVPRAVNGNIRHRHTDCERCGRFPAKNLVTTYVTKGLKMCGHCRHSTISYYRQEHGGYGYNAVVIVEADYDIENDDEALAWVQPLKEEKA